MKTFRQKLNFCPSNAENDYQSVPKKAFISANYALDKLTSVLTTPLQTFAEIRKRFDQPTAKNLAIFHIFSSAKGPLDS